MTFTEGVAEVCARLNLTSAEAITRVGVTFNRVYKKVTTSIGLNVSRHTEVFTTANIGSQFITFDDIEKVNSVVDKSGGANRFLAEVSLDELEHAAVADSDTPTKYAIYRSNAGSVQIKTNANAQTAYQLYAIGFERAAVLSGSQEPAFPESFHDVLVEGTLIEEYLKKEKPELSQLARATYEDRMGDLRIFIAKSPQQSIYAGKQSGTTLPGTLSGGSGGSSVNGATSHTQTGLITFDRDPLAPFAVASGSAKVTNLDADLLDGQEGTAYHALANATGTLAVANGGTGQTTALAAFEALSPLTTQGDLLYNDGTHDVRLAKNASATRYLSNTGTSNDPAWAQVNLANGVTGDLPFANLTQGSALSVLGVTGNSTADVASIAAASDGQVMRRSGAAIAFGALSLATAAAVTGVLPTANGGTSVDIASAALPLGSGQITFPAAPNASANANTLDEYEEGTWTPGDGSGAALSLTVVSSQYVKIGQLVICSFDITFPVTASGANVQITGLPFTSQSTASNVWGGFISATSVGATHSLLVSAGGTGFIVLNNSGAQITNVTYSAKFFRGVIIYRASA